MLASMENRVRRWLYGRDLAVWYAPEYRWPLSALEARTGFQARRADFALWFLLERRALRRSNLRLPRRAGYDELARVHTPELLDSLGRAETLAQIFGIDPSDVPVDEMMNTVRLVCGAVIDAAREMVFQPNPRRVGRRALNLLGGFGWKTISRAASMTAPQTDRKSTRLNSSHRCIAYAVFCL